MLNSLSTHRKRPPAVYWVKDARLSPLWIRAFEWLNVAEGINMLEPAGIFNYELSVPKNQMPSLRVVEFA